MKSYKAILLLLLLSVCFTSTNAQQSFSGFQEYPLRKKIDIPATLASKDLEITLQLDGLQPLDFINVRPKERNFGVTGGAVRKGIERGIQMVGNFSASCATLSTDTLTFVRPVVFQDPVFLHIEIPEGARVKIIVDGKVMLNASITDPIAFRNGELVEGKSNAGLAMFYAAVAGPVNVVQKLGDNFYSVPASKMEIVKKSTLPTELGKELVVGFQIDEKGNVIRVKLGTVTPLPDVENLLKEWQFAPYLVEGQAVRVFTVMKIKL